MDCNERADAFLKGHKDGFEHGYKAAMAGVYWILTRARDTVSDVEDQHIKQKYHDIFKGLEEPSPAVVAVLQEMQRREAEV